MSFASEDDRLQLLPPLSQVSLENLSSSLKISTQTLVGLKTHTEKQLGPDAFSVFFTISNSIREILILVTVGLFVPVLHLVLTPGANKANRGGVNHLVAEVLQGSGVA